MLKAEYRPITLRFKETAITSRSSMTVKESFLVRVWDDANLSLCGVGEVALFRGLSAEDSPNFEDILAKACTHPEELPEISSIRFGFESAVADLHSGGKQLFADTPFTRGEAVIPINGLIWMGTKERMRQRIREKLDSGFRCLKLKIGALNFNDELELLQAVRSEFSPADLELRVDANGAFHPSEAYDRLCRLAPLSIHSIEQPIKAGQPEEMARLCSSTPIPIALDEELIGFRSDAEKMELLRCIAPQYIILKPSLCGGFKESEQWIAAAESLGIGWWATSALESNVGLNAIAQWVSGFNTSMPQGLGTGALYEANFPSALVQERDYLRFDPEATLNSESIWKLNF